MKHFFCDPRKEAGYVGITVVSQVIFTKSVITSKELTLQRLFTSLFSIYLLSLSLPCWLEWFLQDLSAWPDPWVHPLDPSVLAWLGLAPCPCPVPGLRAAAEGRWSLRHQAALTWPLTSGLVVGAGSSVLALRRSGNLDHSVAPIL